jgi:hypothetical protein
MLNVSKEQEDTNLGRMRAPCAVNIQHIKQLNDDYTELTRSYVAIQVEMASLRTEIKWLKMLMVPIAVASLISAYSVITG